MHCRRVAIRTGYSRCVHQCHGITAVPVGITSCFKNSASSFIKRPGSLRGPRVIFKSTADVRTPNITGYLCKSDFSNDTSYTGVFSQTERGSAWGGGTSGYENTWDSPYFSARAANSTYGSSSVVQPASIRLMLCIKI